MRTDTPRRIVITLIGGPTALLEVGGLRLLTDPTFDRPGRYQSPSGVVLTKLAGPALSPDEVGWIDAVLLSHDQHPDNLDRAGRELLARVPIVLSTASAEQRLGGATRGLAPWQQSELQRPDGATLRVTAVPAQHGPEGAEQVSGPVTGFVLAGDGLPSVYVSGDNASVDVVREMVGRLGAPMDVAVLFAGGARPGTFGGAYVTLSSEAAAEAAGILGAEAVVPVHFEGWSHFTEGADRLREAFTRAGLADRLRLLSPSESVVA
jgi:L-ascorbate metabolism protein UlaG (beta-lactamase superfamily)